MSGPIYGNGKRDEAEAGVIAAFRSGGASVAQVSGKDLPDLLVGFLRETHLVEVKTNRAGLRDGQAKFARTWLGSPVIVARTPAQARKWLTVWRSRTVVADAPVNWQDAVEQSEREGDGRMGKDPEQPA